ncbi:MAG: class I SAM-dependent rRNA methyltransferase [Desulfurococcales archaeon]|nr:class I SAM-dependent rRNA methyltransferase [Desulfurococcales archaeon]
MTARYSVAGIGARELEKGATVVYEKWIKRKEVVQPGELVELETSSGVIVCGLWDGAGHVGVRVLSREPCTTSDPVEAIESNLESALRLRHKIGLADPSMGFRLVNSDGDLMPGLIIDVYNDIAVIQSSSLGFDQYLRDIAFWLSRETGVQHVFEKSVQRSRRDIGLKPKRGWLKGSKREAIIDEYGVRFIVDVVEGQKTGFFLDQRGNRREFGSLAGKGDSVLDVFSYTGGFGLHAAYNGASRLVFIEEDPVATRILRRNLELNGFTNYNIMESSVWQAMTGVEGVYDLVSIDPPAFIQENSGSAVRKGLKAYKAVYKFGLDHTGRNGVAYLSSCSYFLTQEMFVQLIGKLTSRLNARIIGSIRKADRDHTMNTTGYLEYLKGVFIHLS